MDLAAEYGRYGYRRITAMLRTQGWHVNAKRVQRIWRREGLKVPRRQPKRGRLWLADGSCVRLRPCWPGHVWAYDFVGDRTSDGRTFRMLTVIDEYTRECLAIVVARRLTSDDVLQVLTNLFVERGPPEHIRSDNVLYREAEGCSGQQVSVASLHRRWDAHQHQTRWPPPRWRSSRP